MHDRRASQSIPPGLPADAGASVDVTVADPIRVTVPQIINMMLAPAQEAIVSRGLAWGTPVAGVGTQLDGTVIGQSPAAGTNVPLGSTVTPTAIIHILVPNVLGLTTAQATAKLTAANLKAAPAAQLSDQTLDTVLSQTPVAGSSALQASTVNIIVADGKPIPNMVGHLTSEFSAPLTDGQFVLNIKATTPSQQPIGTVLDQSPAGGTKAPLKTVIQVSEAAGVAVPNLAGLTPAAAKSALDALKLGMTATGAGVVVKQNPVAGTMVPLATNVVVTLADPNAFVSVPNLVGRTVAVARTMLASLNLAVGASDAVFSTAAVGTIVSQDPAAGTRVPRGTSIDFEVSRGPLRGGNVFSTPGALITPGRIF